MGIKPNILASILSQGYSSWTNITTGSWQLPSTWNRNIMPIPTAQESVHIINGKIFDDGSATNKQNKVITIDTSGYFNPLNTFYNYGVPSKSYGAILDNTKIIMKNNSTLVFPNTNSTVSGDIVIAGDTNINIAMQGSFSGAGVSSFGGAGKAFFNGDNPATNAGYFVYPKIANLYCTDDLFITIGNSYLGTNSGNVYPTISRTINVPYGKTLAISGVNGLQDMIIQSTCVVNVSGTLKSGDHFYNNGVEIQCGPANISGGGTIDCVHSQIYLNPPSFNYQNIGGSIKFASGGLGFANFTSSGLTIDTNITWVASTPGSLFLSTHNLSPTLIFKELIAYEDGSHGSFVGINENAGLATYNFKKVTIPDSVTSFQFQTDSSNIPYNHIIFDSINCPIGSTIYFVPAWATFSNTMAISGTLFTQTGSILEVPSGKTLTVKNLTINYSPQAPGTYIASTLVSFTGAGQVVVVG